MIVLTATGNLIWLSSNPPIMVFSWMFCTYLEIFVEAFVLVRSFQSCTTATFGVRSSLGTESHSGCCRGSESRANDRGLFHDTTMRSCSVMKDVTRRMCTSSNTSRLSSKKRLGQAWSTCVALYNAYPVFVVITETENSKRNQWERTIDNGRRLYSKVSHVCDNSGLWEPLKH